MKNTFLQPDWCSLNWTPWIKFSESANRRLEVPKVAGLYRIKPVGIDKIVYIGQTGRDLRERVLGQLIKHTLAEEMPFNDPHTAAPSLWSLKDANGWEFEFSVAPKELSKENREGLECYLLWQYRLETGESTFCNHGRFHKDYIKSKDRKSSFRGRRLMEDEPRNQAWGESFPPLPLKGLPVSNDFMGLNWSSPLKLSQESLKTVQNLQGVYRIYQGDEILYIGESMGIAKRLKSHIRTNWGEGDILFSYCFLQNATKVQLKEVENDLIGGYYSSNGQVPRFQFRNQSNLS
jgi:hypothetical protein